jgi:hypothetical protein
MRGLRVEIVTYRGLNQQIESHLRGAPAIIFSLIGCSKAMHYKRLPFAGLPGGISLCSVFIPLETRQRDGPLVAMAAET